MPHDDPMVACGFLIFTVSFSHISSLFHTLMHLQTSTCSATFVLLGMGIPAMLPKEGKKSSKYISMIEGRHGKLAEEHGH